MELDLSFDDWGKYKLQEMYSGEWTILYSNEFKKSSRSTVFSALVDTSKVEKYLDSDTWDFRLHDGIPESISYWDKKEFITAYSRYGNNDGIEPIIIIRNIPFEEEAIIDINQEIIHFYNLSENVQDKNYTKFINIDDNGDEEIVIEKRTNLIQIKTKYIRDFIAKKRKSLALYFELDRRSKKNIEELGFSQKEFSIRKDNYHYQVNIFKPSGVEYSYSSTSAKYFKISLNLRSEICALFRYLFFIVYVITLDELYHSKVI